LLKNIDKGMLFMFFSALVSALNGAVAKIISEDMSALEIVLFRNLIGLFLILLTLKHTPSKLKGGKIGLLLVRGLLGFSAMILFFYTISTIPLGEAIVLNKTSPLFVSVLAFYLLNEHLSKRAILALFVGFIGIVLITKPFDMAISYEHFLGVLGGFLAAAAYTTIKKIKNIYDTRVIMLSFLSVGTFLPALFFLIAPYIEAPHYVAFLFPSFTVPKDLTLWLLIGFMSLVATLSQWLLTKAYSMSNLSLIGVVSYMNIPFAIGFGFVLGDSFPDILSFIGIGLIVIGGVLVGFKSK